VPACGDVCAALLEHLRALTVRSALPLPLSAPCGYLDNAGGLPRAERSQTYRQRHTPSGTGRDGAIRRCRGDEPRTANVTWLEGVPYAVLHELLKHACCSLGNILEFNMTCEEGATPWDKRLSHLPGLYGSHLGMAAICLSSSSGGAFSPYHLPPAHPPHLFPHPSIHTPGLSMVYGRMLFHGMPSPLAHAGTTTTQCRASAAAGDDISPSDHAILSPCVLRFAAFHLSPPAMIRSTCRQGAGHPQVVDLVIPYFVPRHTCIYQAWLHLFISIADFTTWWRDTGDCISFFAYGHSDAHGIFLAGILQTRHGRCRRTGRNVASQLSRTVLAS